MGKYNLQHSTCPRLLEGVLTIGITRGPEGSVEEMTWETGLPVASAAHVARPRGERVRVRAQSRRDYRIAQLNRVGG